MGAHKHPSWTDTAGADAGLRPYGPLDRLAEGGDERIILDAETGRNRYGCGLLPDEDAWAFGSSTASVISESAYEAVLAIAQTLDRQPSEEAAYARGAQRVRERLAGLCGVPDVADDVILGASGTDLHLIAAELARGGSDAALTCIMPEPDETGRGVGSAVRSLRFADRTPHGEPAAAGEPLAGVATGRFIPTALRTADGAPRPTSLVDADAEQACDQTMAAEGRAMLVLADVSKTGLHGPSSDCASRLKQRHGDALTVVVDACQFRLSNAAIADYLRRDFLVALTGSKFIGGPAFSGALIVSPASAPRLRRQALPRALDAASGRQDWPAAYEGREGLRDRPNIGLLLRWEAALHELSAFRTLPEGEVDRFVAAFARHVRQVIEANPALDGLTNPPLNRARPDSWDAQQTIFPFLVLKDGRPLSPEPLQALYRKLQGGRRAVHLGQPVLVGQRDGRPVSALRLSLSARLIVEALTTPAGEAAVMARAAQALAAAAAMAGA